MKKILSLCLILMMAIIPAVTQSQAKSSSKSPVIKFEVMKQDLGTVREKGGKVSVEFPFKNVGNSDLVITTTYASCGCTQPSFPEEPIAPGQSGVIKVTFNPANRPGEINSTVTVRSNDKANKKVVLRLTGVVIPEK